MLKEDERIAELVKRKTKAETKASQCAEQIKRLQQRKTEKGRKERTHALIVCGAELAKLFGTVLTEQEVLQVVDFLQAKMKSGEFALSESKTTETQETKQELSGSDKLWDEFWG